MATENLKVNDVVQINPKHDDVFGGAFMVVTEPKEWGAQGFVPMGAEEGRARLAFYRCPHEAMELIGRAVWTDEESADADE